MNFKLKNLVATTLAGSFLMGFGVNAMADTTTDIVNALVAKGVLTEEEGALLTKGREMESTGQAKAMKKATKLSVSDAIDNATLYGDIRVRAEARSGDGLTATAGTTQVLSETGKASSEDRTRARYKLTFGVKTDSGPWYTDLALAMGANGRSDNATFGKSATANINDKETLFVKRAMVGFKATDWLTLEAGRMDNPLYTTPMVWDADLTWEGFSEKVKYKVGDADLFFTAAQAQYQGDKKTFETNGLSGNTTTTELFAFQGGAKYAINDRTSAKGAVAYTKYSHNTGPLNPAVFTPGLATQGAGNAAATGGIIAGNGYQIAAYGTNDLDVLEIPAEVNFMATSNIGIRLFGDYAYNTSGSDRYNAAWNAATGAANKAAIQAAGNDDVAWLLGVAVGSTKDLKAFEGNKMAKGDWSARVWYQDVGAYSVDPNAVDSDFMDSRVNMKGTTFKAQYNIQDNVLVNFAYGHATRKNGALGAAGAANDLALNLSSFDLLQLDLTYKF